MTTRYAFLVLSVLFLVPGALVFGARRDLRPLMIRTALASLPFAATESLFYPAYWRPAFLFDLADHIGFGVEDVLFVVGLSAFACTAFPVATRRTVAADVRVKGSVIVRALAAIIGAIAITLALMRAHLPVLYACVAAMALVTLAMLAARPELAIPGVVGALLTAAVYLALCLVFAALVPGVFTHTWRPSVLLPGVHLLGVPADELLYGAGSGLVGTVFPMWAFGLRFVSRREQGTIVARDLLARRDAHGGQHGREEGIAEEGPEAPLTREEEREVAQGGRT